MKKVLIYSFTAFQRLSDNPAADVARKVARALDGVCSVWVEILPTTYRAWDTLKTVIQSVEPDLILGVGVAQRSRVCVEALGLNVADAVAPDNDGVVLRHTLLESGGPMAVASNIDTQGLLECLRGEAVPAIVSYFPETFVCNAVFYRTLRFGLGANSPRQVGFVHVPLAPKNINELGVDAPSFPPEQIAGGVAKWLRAQTSS